MKKLIVLGIAFLATGCASVATVDRPPQYYAAVQGVDGEEEEQLFGSDGSVLSDQDIARILSYRLQLPAQNRIAVLRLSKDNYWRFYSNDFTELSDSMAEDFIGQLRASDRVYDAAFLPAMLTPERRTVPFLREAAARYQADLLLAYRTGCRTYEKYRLLNPNETRAYCTVETVLLDVRSGIVPFTAVVSDDFSAVKEAGDTNFTETVKRAELAAIDKSLKESARKLVRFLAQAERL